KHDSHCYEVQGNDLEILAAKNDDAGIARKSANECSGRELRQDRKQNHEATGDSQRGIKRLADTIGAAAAEVLPDDGSDRESYSNHREKHRLHDARADPEAGLRRCAETTNDGI